jgi:maleylpyruvate isomerase
MGARQVRATDPGVLADLASVRLGTAFFRRALNLVPDDEFGSDSLLAGWTRRHLVAHVGYNARAVARLVTWASTGVETPMYVSPQARSEEIEQGATLRPEALRSLCEHAAIDLDVRWRDLPDQSWGAMVTTAQGRRVPASETLWMRCREVWLHAVDLDVGARVSEVPAPVLSRLLRDVAAMWAKRGQLDELALCVETEDGPLRFGDTTRATTLVSGRLPQAVEWATGRALVPEDAQVTWERGAPRAAPRWL